MEVGEDILLAGFFGVLTGDGFINQYRYPKRLVSVIEISGNKSKDSEYINKFVFNSVKKLFNVAPRIYFRENQNVIRLIVNSKEIVQFFKEKGFPFGRKGNIKTPNWILTNQYFLCSFIRGFFDTDRYLCLKNKEGKKYPVIGLGSISLDLLKEIKNFLDKQGISSYLGIQFFEHKENFYKLQISGKKNINLFFKVVGSNNPRNLLKYEEMCKL